jgi:predicted component of type VI protein secretion system
VEYSARANQLAARQTDRRTASGDEAPVRALSKVVLSDAGKTIAELHLVPGRKVVGRTPDNDLQIDSKFISRHHCQLITGSDGITVIEDLNSTNGILVHGKRVRRHTLRDGDLIGLGQYDMLYVNAGAGEHLADTHDDLPAISADAANEESGDDEREDAAGAG